MTGAMLLIFEVATGDRGLAITAVVGVAVLLIALAVLPVIVRSNGVRVRLEWAVTR